MTADSMNLTDADTTYMRAETRRLILARCYVALAEVDYELRAWAAGVAR